MMLLGITKLSVAHTFVYLFISIDSICQKVVQSSIKNMYEIRDIRTGIGLCDYVKELYNIAFLLS